MKPNSRHEGVELCDDGVYLVKVNAPPTEGKANERLIELLAGYLNCPKSKIELVSGHKAKRKTFKVPG